MERTFTFLFTDIEGSTRLWDEQPDLMSRALRWHDDLLRRAITENGGQIFKTVGDAFCAAFPTADQAAQAALNAQNLLESPAPGNLRVRVRMALHAGSAEERGGDFFGPTLNRVARLLAVGHGGQTLLTQAARDGLSGTFDRLIQDRGSHRLRDLARDEWVYELVTTGDPNAPSPFPPLRSLSSLSKHNLPVQLTSFIGRETELADVKTRAGKTRLLTLTGSGGCGKTRLMLQAAGEMLSGDGDGVWLVELAPLQSPSDVVPAIAQAVRVREVPGVPLIRTLTDELKSQRLLLLLDNCEHLLQTCAEVSHALLTACPQLTILATSRQPLGIWGEQTYRVPSLPLPPFAPEGARTSGTSIEELSGFASVRLFVERTQQWKPEFELSSATSPAVTSICRRLDGIPFAIELAAARARSLTVEKINDGLDNRFRLLTGGSRAALPRQQTLQATIAWSYDLLTIAERRLLGSLSVFAGGWTLEAAEAVGADDEIEAFDVLDLVDGLLSKSLVQEDGNARYRMLETVRQYAGDRLRETEASAAVSARHLNYFADWIERTNHQIEESRHQRDGLTAIDADYDNLRAAMQWGVEHPDGEAALKLGAALFRYWETRGLLREGQAWIEKLRAACPPDGTPSVTQVRAAHSEAMLNSYQGRQEVAVSLYELALTYAHQCGEGKQIAMIEGQLGNILSGSGDTGRGLELQEASARRHKELGDAQMYAVATGNLGVTYQMLGQWDKARAALEEALAAQKRLGNGRSAAITLHNLGRVYLEQGDLKRSGDAQKESLQTFLDLDAPTYAVYCLEAFSYLAYRQGDANRAARLAGAASQVRQTIGAVLNPMDAEEFTREQQPIRDALGEDGYRSAWDDGAKLSLAQAADVAFST